jgi:NADP-dependent 3-hydroxy acid dehydrogenase YdfG
MSNVGVAVVTGASSGFGEASARRLAKDGWDVVVGARRFDRLQKLAAEIGGRAIELDVTSGESVDAFRAQVPECKLLVNNAGGALGMDSVENADIAQWQEMYEVNVIGVLRMTKAFLPASRRLAMA